MKFDMIINAVLFAYSHMQIRNIHQRFVSNKMCGQFLLRSNNKKVNGHQRQTKWINYISYIKIYVRNLDPFCK